MRKIVLATIGSLGDLHPLHRDRPCAEGERVRGRAGGTGRPRRQG
ncbi:hypothetical protein NHF48_018995 [Sphingomonas sp. H160509]|nr:hypothetical protein [Sphingomonas sp. H160509]MDD1452542.1 hypothetical protein [Sphingomonas sp. H160509]